MNVKSTKLENSQNIYLVKIKMLTLLYDKVSDSASTGQANGASEYERRPNLVMFCFRTITFGPNTRVTFVLAKTEFNAHVISQ